MIISSAHGIFHFPLISMSKTVELKNFLLRKLKESFDTGIGKKLRNKKLVFNTLPETFSKEASFSCVKGVLKDKTFQQSIAKILACSS